MISTDTSLNISGEQILISSFSVTFGEKFVSHPASVWDLCYDQLMLALDNLNEGA